jgi:ribosome-binding ATPase YchF (GTP1/OBG family)
MQIGIVGKPNVGKSTFFCAATLASAEIANYPFTTIKANRGVAFVRGRCPHLDFNTQCVPRNAGCDGGTRMIPIELLDVAGLVPEASQGRGLGNQFLDDLRQANALIHVVDASGSTDMEGNAIPPGSHDPVEDIKFLEREIALWIRGIMEKGWEKASRQAHMSGQPVAPVIHDRLTGLGVTEAQVLAALREANLPDNPMSWEAEDMLRIADAVRRYSKPMIIALNKADLAVDVALDRLSKAAGGMSIPTTAESELALRRAAKAKLVDYIPGEDHFKVTEPSKLNANQAKALEKIGEGVKRLQGTGIQKCLEKAAFELLDLIIVYPVEDESRLTDHDGRVLPDAFLVPKGTTARGLAYKVHTDLGEGFIRAINVRTHRTVGHDYVLQNNDVLTIISRK